MTFLRRKKKSKQVERRKPENFKLRQEFDSERKTQVKEELVFAKQLTDSTAERIDRLREIAHLLDIGKKG